MTENKELQELEIKVREMLNLLTAATDLKNTAKMEVLGDEAKKQLINQAWQLIDKIHEISKNAGNRHSAKLDPWLTEQTEY